MTAICDNHDDVDIMVMLIDERPEEVTDFRRNTPDRVEVVASTSAEDASGTFKWLSWLWRRVRRVECGRHVVVPLDSITRLARGTPTLVLVPAKIGTGGVDSAALIVRRNSSVRLETLKMKLLTIIGRAPGRPVPKQTK